MRERDREWERERERERERDRANGLHRGNREGLLYKGMKYIVLLESSAGMKGVQ